MEKMPMGVVGFLFVAIMAAAMSTLDSSINSLSAASVEDIYKKLKRKTLTPRQETNISKLFTLFWGLFCIGFAFLVGNISATIIEAINKVGSIFYGPIFAVFLAGIISTKPQALPAIVGLISGVLANLSLWLFFPSVSWLWWNVVGFLIATIIVFIGSTLFYSGVKTTFRIEVRPEKRIWKISYASLIMYVVGLIILLYFLPAIF
jgi:Na+/proline symporter